MFNAINRREFIAAGAATTAALGASPLMHAAPSRASGMSFIHLFLPGGWPCNDLWDPKRYTPFQAGMRGSELTSTSMPIETSAPGVMVGELLIETAKEMHHGLIVRSVVDPTNTTDHAAAQQRMRGAFTFGSAMRETSVADSFSTIQKVTRGEEREDDLGQYLTLHNALSAAVAYGSHVRVTDAFEAYQGFDAHESGSNKLWRYIRLLDITIAETIRSLEQSNQLDRTILCISSEFNRTIAGRPAPGSDLNTGENLVINDERDYGFHAHFAEANSIVLFGGPFKRGFVYGKTGPRHPMRVVENPVTLADMHATIAVALGETPREGRVITDLFA